MEQTEQLLRQLAPAPPDPCDSSAKSGGDYASLDFKVRDAAEAVIADRLNDPALANKPAQMRAELAAKDLEDLSSRIDTAWPSEKRLQLKLFDLAPALVVQWSIRSRGGYIAFGIPSHDNAKKAWQEIGEDQQMPWDAPPWSELTIYPLHRGRSEKMRFLAASRSGGCAGSYGIAYNAEEWDPASDSGLEQIIEQTGSCGLEYGCGAGEKTGKDAFAPIGNLRTSGTVITLPYCEFTAVDSWDNPSLCAVDAYDLSGDEARFVSRTYNRPDLAPVAKAIGFAQQHDLPAVLGYCASPAVARKLVRSVPPFVSASPELQVVRIGADDERIDLGDGGLRFEVKKMGERWLVVSLSGL